MIEVMSRYALVWPLACTGGAALFAWWVARWAAACPTSRNCESGTGQARLHRLTPRARTLLVAIALGGSATFAAIVWALAQPGALDAFDQDLARGLAQSLNSLSLAGVAQFTKLGDRAYLMGVASAVLVILLWRKDWVLAAVWVAASAGGGLLNAVLKATFERVRPDHAHGFVQTSGFSFPSGHATGAVAVYAMLAFVLLRFTPPARHPAIFAAATALVVGIGLSRVLLHVHFISDVLAGCAITGAWVALCVLALDRLDRHRPMKAAVV